MKVYHSEVKYFTLRKHKKSERQKKLLDEFRHKPDFKENDNTNKQW